MSGLPGRGQRSTARQLVKLVLVSPGQPISREAACEALFPHLEAVKAATALRKSLSMARSALSALGHDATQVLAATGPHLGRCHQGGVVPGG